MRGRRKELREPDSGDSRGIAAAADAAISARARLELHPPLASAITEATEIDYPTIFPILYAEEPGCKLETW